MITQEQALTAAADIKAMNSTIKTMQLAVKSSIELLQRDCPHVEETHTTDYIPGSYYDTATYINIYTCNLCGRVRREISSGGYG